MHLMQTGYISIYPERICYLQVVLVILHDLDQEFVSLRGYKFEHGQVSGRGLDATVLLNVKVPELRLHNVGGH